MHEHFAAADVGRIVRQQLVEPLPDEAAPHPDEPEPAVVEVVLHRQPVRQLGGGQEVDVTRRQGGGQGPGAARTVSLAP